MNIKNEKAFTLAETLIVLTILGIIASITIPSLLKNYFEIESRTKFKKAITMYDIAIQKMVLENNIKSKENFINWADSNIKNNCKNTSAYFKASNTGCLFKTPDRITWYIGDIMQSIVSVKPLKTPEEAIERANNKNDKSTFYFITLYDSETNVFRTNDLAYTIANADEQTAQKLQNLYDYIDNKKISTTEEIADNNNEDNSGNNNNDGDTQQNQQQEIYTQVCNSTGCCVSYAGQKCKEVTLPIVKNIDENGRTLNSGSGCVDENTCASWNNNIYDDIGNNNEIQYIGWTCSSVNMGSCPEPASGNVYYFNINGQTMADITCKGSSCTCAGRRWPDKACTPENYQKINESMQKQGLPYTIQP